MSQAVMMSPAAMAERYSRSGGRGFTPAQNRRITRKLRRIYGMTNADRTAWVSAARAKGYPVY